LRGGRQAPLYHRRLQRVAAAVAAGDHLHPGLDPTPGPQLGPVAQTGLRRRRARGAALLVAGEVGHPRTDAVRRDPGGSAWLACVEMDVEAARIRACRGVVPPTAKAVGDVGRGDASGTTRPRVIRCRTGTTTTTTRRSPAPQATTTATARAKPADRARHRLHRPPPPRARRLRAHGCRGRGHATAPRPRIDGARRTPPGRPAAAVR